MPPKPGKKEVKELKKEDQKTTSKPKQQSKSKESNNNNQSNMEMDDYASTHPKKGTKKFGNNNMEQTPTEESIGEEEVSDSDSSEESQLSEVESVASSAFARQLKKYYDGTITKLKNLNKEEFGEQIKKLYVTLNVFSNEKDYTKYPFGKMEESISACVKENLQKHILNILTHYILYEADYDGEFSANTKHIIKADKKSKFEANDDDMEDYAGRITHYKNYLIGKDFIPEWERDKIDETNNDNLNAYQNEQMEWLSNHDADEYNEDRDNTPPPTPPTTYEPSSVDAFCRKVFDKPNDLQNLIKFCKDPKEGLSWLIADYAENIFDSDEEIINAVIQKNLNVDYAVAELIFDKLYFYRNYESILESFADEKDFGWLAKVYLEGLNRIAQLGFKKFVKESIETLKDNYAVIVESLDKNFKKSVDDYNKAYDNYDLPAMQKAWYIFSQKQKKYIETYTKDYTSNTSIKSFQTTSKKIQDKVAEEFLSVFPENLETISASYSFKHPNKKSAELNVKEEWEQLSAIGRSVKEIMGNHKIPDTTNVVVAELVFLVSDKGYVKGGDHKKTFIKVPITFDSKTKLLSRDNNKNNNDDGIIKSDSEYKKQIEADHNIAVKFKLPVKQPEINDNTLEELFYHSERVLLAALRKPELLEQLMDKLVDSLGGGEGKGEVEMRKVYGGVLMLYSTNSVCDNCAYSLIANQNDVKNLITVQNSLQNVLAKNNNFLLHKDVLKLITLVTSEKPFSTQAKILYNENKTFGNQKAKIYLDDGNVDLYKVFKLPNSSKIIIESIDDTGGKAEDDMPKEKGLAFMSGSKWSKLGKSENKLKKLEEDIDKFYSNNNNNKDESMDGSGLLSYYSENSLYWYQYSKTGMQELLNLRLESTGLDEKVKTIIPDYFWDESVLTAERLVSDISPNLRSEDKVLVILNLYAKHWVGLVIDKTSDGQLNISYMDPEQNQMPALLKETLIKQLVAAYPGFQIRLSESELEPQKYNNCGPEVIENFMQYLTGDRLGQEDAVVVHSALLENSLLLGEGNYDLYNA